VCSPTRASLLTGRYNYRTGVVDTYLGRSMMRPTEVTFAELLRDAGYRTGIFGKWHLGDCYPLRAIDKGFQEALVCKGGGIGQPSDPPGNKYFDPVLFRNGKAEKCRGYCSDIFTDEAMKFVEKSVDKPFFLYLAFNAPHEPLQVDDKLVEPYRKMDLSPAAFPKIGLPVTNPATKEQTARVYAMVENIDTNLGKLFKLLDDKNLAKNTLVIFLTDNGPAHALFNTGLHGRKGSVYDGGIRVPCFVRWPDRFGAGTKLDFPAAHIDVTPTILDCCQVQPPKNLDGIALTALLRDRATARPERNLFFQWHRGDVPVLHRAFAVRGPRYKLVQAVGAGDYPQRDRWNVQLFDLLNDPYEQTDLSDKHPDIVRAMGKAYKDWFADVGKDGYDPPRIYLGAEQENPVTLTRQDWRGPRAGWRIDDLGQWEITVARPGTYTVIARFAPRTDPATAHLRIGAVTVEQKVEPRATEIAFRDVKLPKGDARFEAWVNTGSVNAGMTYVEVERLRE